MNELEHLARQYSFNALSAAEQEMVLANMSRDEFDALREILLLAPILDAGPRVSPKLKAALTARLAAQPHPTARFLQKQVPLWQAAAVLTAVVFALWLVKKEQVRVINVPLVQIQIDTIYREKIAWRERVVVREKIVYREKTPAEPIAVKLETLENQFIANPWTNSAPTPDVSQAPLGSSLADEPELLDFFIDIK